MLDFEAKDEAPAEPVRDGHETGPTANGSNQQQLHAEGYDNTPRISPGDRFHQLFASRVTQQDGEQPAIEMDSDVYTLEQLDALANQISHHLLALGALPGDRIALLFDRSIHAYASVLAVSKIGGIFVPLDPGMPVFRIEYICRDSQTKLALTTSFYTGRFADTKLKVSALDVVEEEYLKLPKSAPMNVQDADRDDCEAYIIYTSGTTGNPKGVPVRHSSICNFLRVAAELYGFESTDRVFQSLALAFDYSFEEIWVPLLCGACLVPAPSGVNLLGDDLAEFLLEKRITAWCSVPTILATLQDDNLPDLRLLIVSGETCPRDIVDRWATADRVMLNLYGPTETTVTATWARLNSGHAVTIGTPLPTYTIAILAVDGLALANAGEPGEIAIAGIGLANGYLNRELETDKSFVQDFLNLKDNPTGKIYRTGDLGRITKDGEIEYLGRLDTQVKIRGLRIELEEIESQARKLSALDSVVVNPVELEPGNRELVAYYVHTDSAQEVDINALHSGLKTVLPPYMIPTYFERLEVLPLLPSQKVDRSRLPAPTGLRLQESGKAFVVPAEGLEQDLAGIMCKLMKLERVSTLDDFFADLGANSLLMARFLGSVRGRLGIQSVSMRDIYLHKDIRSLAQQINKSNPRQSDPQECSAKSSAISDGVTANRPVGASVSQQREPYIASNGQLILCAVLQCAAFAVSAFFAALAALAAFSWINESSSLMEAYLKSVATGFFSIFGVGAVLIAVKWVMVGQVKATEFPIWSVDYVRFWVAKCAIRINPLNLFFGTPVYNVFLRLLGVKVGSGAVVLCRPPIAADLVSIGANACVRRDCLMPGYTVKSGYLRTGHIKIGVRTHIAEATVLDINTEIGDDAQLANRSAIHENQSLKGGDRYWGSPATTGAYDFIRVPELPVSKWRGWIYILGHIAGASLTLYPIPFVAAYLLAAMGLSGDAAALQSLSLLSTLSDLALVACGAYFGTILIASARVLVIPRLYNFFFVPNKVHPIYGFQYFLATKISAISHSNLLQELLGDSSLIVPYFKAIGYNLRSLTQNGSNFGVEQRQDSPFLCKFSLNTIVSDGLVLLNMDLGRTSFKMSNISMPDNTNLGNDIYYPVGARIGPNCLIATKALVPLEGALREQVGILGSPPIEIPRPVQADGRLKHYRSPEVFASRLRQKLISNLGTLLLYMFRNLSAVFLAISASYFVYQVLSDVVMNSMAIAAGFSAALAISVAVTMVAYFIMYERMVNWYRPMKPQICSLYERPFWDHERFWKMNINPLLNTFNGTPMKSFFLRMQGVKVGRQIFDDGVSITEPHLVEIGDYVSLNQESVLQSHSLEDATFKADTIRIGDRCTVGLAAFIHYGTVVGDDAEVMVDSFLMKGSKVKTGESWHGNPAQPVASP